MRTLPLGHAVALGLLHGPTELLPISSAAHTTLAPWLAGWPYDALQPRARKSFEVALHAGTAAALLRRSPGGGRAARAPAEGERRGIGARLGFLAAALAPATLGGYALGEWVERRLGTPGTIATGLLAGSGGLLAGEAHAAGRARAARDAGLLDGLALGLAQALALMPGVSRNGATLAAARWRGFSRRDCDRLSWSVGLPVIAGASLLQGVRLAREGTPRELRLSLAAGALSAFGSTLLSARLLDSKRRAALLPACCVYRAALALLVIRRMRDNTSRTSPYPKK
jgi:undecaprenyl-diphosphatase